MKKSFKVCLLVIMVCAFALLSVKDVNASDASNEYEYETVILDDEYLLSDEEIDMLYDDMEEISEYGNVMFTTVNLQTSDYEQYCRDTYYEWFGNEPGVIFQIDMGNRELSLCASTGYEKLIGKERDSIIDNVYKYATNEEYYACASYCFEQIGIVLNDGSIAHTMKHIDNGILAVLFALVINYVIACSLRTKKVSVKKIRSVLDTGIKYNGASIKKGKLEKEYSPQSSSSGGSGGGGGGGGGFSGGSSSHGF